MTLSNLSFVLICGCLLMLRVDAWQPVNRRQALLGTSLAWPFTAAAADAPIAVLGASGRTGALCVTTCLQQGIPVRALTRTGVWPPSFIESAGNNNNNPLLTVGACNVQDPAAIAKGIQGCSAVIYAASASAQGGNAKAIDNVGVVSAAQACWEARVSRYIVLSSTATTRPKSLGYIFTNLLVGGIMEEKRLGELAVAQLYDSRSRSSSGSYTIIRPGGLEEPKQNIVLGPSALEISQGDVLTGIVSRADLAALAVAVARSSRPNLRNTALELYYTDSVQPCETKFQKLVSNGQAPRLHGTTYEELLEDVQPGIDYFA